MPVPVRIYAIARLRQLSRLALLIMLAATPIFGNHYLVDIIGGFAIAGISIIISDRLYGTQRRPRSPEAR